MGAVESVRQRLAAGVIAALALMAMAGCQTGTAPINSGQTSLSSARTAMQTRTRASFESAVNLFEIAAQTDQYALEARIGQGDAHLAMAEDPDLWQSGDPIGGRIANYRAAEEAYAAAAARADREGDAGQEAYARQRRGEALLALNDLGATLRRDEPPFLTTAISELEAAAAARPPAAERYLTLATAYIAADRLQDADNAITSGLAAGPAPAQEAEALVAQASVKERLGAPEGEILALLERAKTISPSPQINTTIGALHFNRGDFGAARQAFMDSINASGGGANAKAEAHYYLSVMDTLGSPSNSALASAIANAETAVRTGGGEFRYRRQACLAHIMRGGDSVEEGDITRWCEGADTPEGMLVRGMSSLRLAQYAASAGRERAWSDHLLAAQRDFQRGLELIPGSPDARTLKWPGRPELSMRDVLEFGNAVVFEGCSRRLQQRPNFTPERSTVDELATFYRDYRVFACRV